MKTDYAKLGKEALSRLAGTTAEAGAVQERLLMELLWKNRDTEYGRLHGFAQIRTADQFQQRVPVTDYGDYEYYMEKIISGVQRVLTASPPVYFCLSSGTTGQPKYLPLTEADMQVHYWYAYAALFGMVREYYSELDEQAVFGKIFQIGEFAKTYMEDGRMNGIRSSALFQWMDRDGLFDASDYCVPKEVLFPSRLEDLTYVKVRFALAQRKLCAIHGVFINRVAGVMDYICQNWQMLLRDMERGDVDGRVQIRAYWKKYVADYLPADPLRVRELRRIAVQPSDGTLFPQGMITKIWPDMKYVLAIGGRAFANHTEKMKLFAKDMPIHYFAYAASEGIFGISEKMDLPDAYILLPDAGFYEFIPLDMQGEEMPVTPCRMHQLCVGSRYALVFTNQSGLYRYRMGDVIEVVGRHGQAPVVRICYRKNQVLNIAGEKSNLEQLEQAVGQFSRQMQVQVIGYCVQEDFSAALPGYLFYVECLPKLQKEAADILDACISAVNLEYRGCRHMHEIGPPRIEFLRPGSFLRYEKHMQEQGMPMGQAKLLRILDTEEKQQFFASEAKQRI